MKQCANHPRREAVTRCASCRRHLCGDCWLHDVGEDPWCESCIFHLTSRGGNLALGVAFFLMASGLCWAGLRWQVLPDDVWWFTLFGAALGSLFIARGEAPARPGDIKRREPDEVPPRAEELARRAHPYRAALRKASSLVASPVSGTKTAALLALSMALVALALPQLLELPSVAELELVVLGWWLLWGVAGTVLLYRGFRVADDHVLRRPAPPWFLSGRTKWQRQERIDKGCWGCSVSLPLIPILILGVTLASAWLMVEVVLPVLFFLVYYSVRAGLAAVANDEHDCEGHLPRALSWGFIWSSVFAFPLAATLALVRFLGFG